jgi:hypothetical protein
MKNKLILTVLILLISSSSFAKIIYSNKKLFIEQDGHRTPVEMVNQLIKEGKITKVRLFRKGEVHMISFSNDKAPEKLFTVDEKGFIYTLEPYTNYNIKEVRRDGKFSFEEVPGRLFEVSKEGLFL